MKPSRTAAIVLTAGLAFAACGGTDETADDVVGHLKNLPGAADMNAVKNGKVITYRYKYSQASPSAVTGAEVIAEALRKG